MFRVHFVWRMRFDYQNDDLGYIFKSKVEIRSGHKSLQNEIIALAPKEVTKFSLTEL